MRILLVEDDPRIARFVSRGLREQTYAVDVACDGEAGGSGAGLGLSIASWIAEMHGGRVALERSDPTGSTFVASLPL